MVDGGHMHCCGKPESGRAGTGSEGPADAGYRSKDGGCANTGVAGTKRRLQNLHAHRDICLVYAAAEPDLCTDLRLERGNSTIDN